MIECYSLCINDFSEDDVFCLGFTEVQDAHFIWSAALSDSVAPASLASAGIIASSLVWAASSVSIK